jgi:3-oxoacyl-[acyl-carrier protein] reductase
MSSLAGRAALVTGAANGIGAATAQRLAHDGASVVLADLDAAAAEGVASGIRAAGGTALVVPCDVTRREQVEAAVGRCVDELGSIDVLVTCAGLIRDNLVHRMSEEDWDLVVDTHLKGTFLCAQAAQAQMVPRASGTMVFVSSGAARGNRGQANYSAAKAGIEGLARTLAIELGRFGIRVNVVAPGFVVTAMTRSIAERTGRDYDDVVADAAARTALNRVGQPEEIAAAIAFFAGDDSSFATGQTLTVRGGP